jgi:hypothetical protein
MKWGRVCCIRSNFESRKLPPADRLKAVVITEVYVRRKVEGGLGNRWSISKRSGKDVACFVASLACLALFCFPPHPPSHTCAHTYVFHMLQPEEMDARLLSALIVGIRRAFPFVAAEVSIVPFHLS